jgi:uncharacterized protein (DUF362 family)
MDRRGFMQIAAGTAPALAATGDNRIPTYKIVTRHKPVGKGMPGLWPGRVASVHAADCIDESTEKVNIDAVRRMLRESMQALTGDKDARDSWTRFVAPADVVGIKINASGAPNICSLPEVVGAIAENLVAVGVKPENIWVHEKFQDQVRRVNYAAFLPKGAHVETADSHLGYDPFTYVETSFFGEDDTRSNMVRIASDICTKIINVPNMKDHSASGVTGCLKNISYGEFSNVARSHQYSETNTLSFIGTLATVEPVRSKTVLNVMDGIKGVWHAGPFSRDKRFRFYPKQMMVGTDPVAMDRLLIDVIENKRKAENATSVWDRSPEKLERKGAGNFRDDPKVNLYIREPGHIEYASKLGLGIYDKSRIDLREVRS